MAFDFKLSPEAEALLAGAEMELTSGTPQVAMQIRELKQQVEELRRDKEELREKIDETMEDNALLANHSNELEAKLEAIIEEANKKLAHARELIDGLKSTLDDLNNRHLKMTGEDYLYLLEKGRITLGGEVPGNSSRKRVNQNPGGANGGNDNIFVIFK